MKKEHLYIVAAIGALLYWRTRKASTAQTKTTAPVQVGAITLAQDLGHTA
jgi:hypothetical protein